MEIIEFNTNNKKEFTDIVKKYNNIKEFHILTSRLINLDGRTIFLVLKKGILRKYRILGYTIIDQNISLMCRCNNMDEIYAKKDRIICITDFIVRKTERGKGIGSTLAKYILEKRYPKKDIVLQPQGDGYWFWKKFGFEKDNISKDETWILRR